MTFSMTLGGTTLPIKVEDVIGRGPYSQETTLYVLPGRHGAYLSNKKTPERPLQVIFNVSDVKTSSELRTRIDELNGLIRTSQEAPIVFSDEPGLTYYGILSGTPDWKEVRYYGKGTIPFICPDPYKYGAEDTVTLDAAPIMNEGTAETPLIITATFNTVATEYKITHSNEKYVRVIWDFDVGDILVIDLKKRKVTINGIVQMTAYDWRSTPFMLLPGSNSLTVAPAGVATTQITFRPRWL